ncbi:Acyl-CoA dehydrogenase family member 10 [Phlyctema vagabunda]|uniref:Acyl-CoA dehydrogenase family member 10 n=1 Tax=Phlyctema vagabunda TaxID=108571 RepID=A0ABR4PHJ3_9HELO
MSQEDYPIEFVLDSIDAVMARTKKTKVLLFDIGGVCVVSPFQAILDYEIAHNIPTGWVNHCISSTKPDGFWHRLERGEGLMDSSWFAGFTNDLHSVPRWEAFYRSKQKTSAGLVSGIPAMPRIDGEALFWEMMRASRDPDPWMFPALQKLKTDGSYILAALSNTMIFPSDHPYSQDAKGGVRSIFDVFISSAHVGLRKPDPAIYKLAISEVDRFARKNADTERGWRSAWKDGVKAEEIVFFDDIGENLKTAKSLGLGTVKVGLGRAFEAVDQLEEITGMELAGTHPRIPVEPKAKL